MHTKTVTIGGLKHDNYKTQAYNLFAESITMHNYGTFAFSAEATPFSCSFKWILDAS